MKSQEPECSCAPHTVIILQWLSGTTTFVTMFGFFLKIQRQK